MEPPLIVEVDSRGRVQLPLPLRKTLKINFDTTETVLMSRES